MFLARRIAPALVVAALLACAPAAQAADFPVTKTADTADGKCDADCSLREAIGAAQATEGDDRVILPAGTFGLTNDALDGIVNSAGDSAPGGLALTGAGEDATTLLGGDALRDLLASFTSLLGSGFTMPGGGAGDLGALFSSFLSPQAAVPFGGLTVDKQSVRLKGTKSFPVKVSCPASTALSCTGRLTVTASVLQPTRKKPKRKVAITLGTTKFAVLAGNSSTLTVKLKKAGQSAIAKRKWLKASAAAVASDVLGTQKSTSGAVKVSPAKKKKKAKKK